VSRDVLVDGLRAVALAGVVLINAAGYNSFPDTWHIVPPPVPAESVFANATQWALLAFLQAKAYPLLSFLFGLSLVLSLRARRDDGVRHRRRRMGRLLLIGVLHGALLYAGDVLTAYALTGLVLLRWARLPLVRLIRRWWWLLGLSVMVTAVQFALLWLIGQDPTLAPSEGRSYGWASGIAAHVALSAPAYLAAQVFTTMLMAPQLLWLMLSGVIVARLDGLRRARWRPLWARQARWALPLGLALNMALAVVTLHGARVEADPPSPWSALSLLVGPLLSFGFLAWAVSRRPAWQISLAGGGPWTLSIYLSSSVLFMLVLGGAGLGLGPELGSVATAAVGLAGYGVLLAAAVWMGARGWRGTLERWLAAR
jgi:uncharacterized protein